MNITKLNRALLYSTNFKFNTESSRTFSIMNINYKKQKPRYQTSKDLDLKRKQRDFPKLTSKVYVQKEEVKQYDGFSLVEPLIDKTKEPHKLHLLKKIKSVNGEPWWVKEALGKLGFFNKIQNEWKITHTIKPNTPEINDLLWLCKHMIKITPINMDNGEPIESDIKYTKLNLETGKLNIIRELKTFKIDNNICYNVNNVPVSFDLKQHDSFPLDKKEIMRYLHKRKDLLQLNSEYFPTVYDYKYDQDKPGVINIKGLPDSRLGDDD